MCSVVKVIFEKSIEKRNGIQKKSTKIAIWRSCHIKITDSIRKVQIQKEKRQLS